MKSVKKSPILEEFSQFKGEVHFCGFPPILKRGLIFFKRGVFFFEFQRHFFLTPKRPPSKGFSFRTWVTPLKGYAPPRRVSGGPTFGCQFCSKFFWCCAPGKKKNGHNSSSGRGPAKPLGVPSGGGGGGPPYPPKSNL